MCFASINWNKLELDHFQKFGAALQLVASGTTTLETDAHTFDGGHTFNIAKGKVNSLKPSDKPKITAVYWTLKNPITLFSKTDPSVEFGSIDKFMCRSQDAGVNSELLSSLEKWGLTVLATPKGQSPKDYGDKSKGSKAGRH